MTMIRLLRLSKVLTLAAALAAMLMPAVARAQRTEPDTTVRGHIWPALGVRSVSYTI
jgi:hypothetical protein